MISNRDSHTNLAKEVQKKKREVLSKENDEKKRTIIAYSVIGGLALLLILIGFFSYGSDDVTETDFSTPETNSDKYNSKIEALESKQKKQRNTNLLDVFSNEKKDSIVTDTIEENKLKENLKNFNKKPVKKTVRKTPKSNNKDVYGDYTMWEEEDKTRKKKVSSSPKQELTYEERLRLKKEARYGNKTTTTTTSSSNNSNNTVQTRIAIFRDQFLLPGELAELVLTKDFRYNNKLFKKGTPVYGYININKSRVLFDIENIAHEPLKIEVRDIRDGLKGMYSSRAGELWKKYEAEGLNDATENATNDITNNKILSNSIDVISGFFQKKRLNKNDKIMLLNDQELIVHVLNK